jgi:hypothetical protein
MARKIEKWFLVDGERRSEGRKNSDRLGDLEAITAISFCTSAPNGA